MFSPTAPTATTRARSRAMTPASSTGSFEGVSAQISTTSKPRLAVKATDESTAWSRVTASSPSEVARAMRCGSMSMPSTRHPAAVAICAPSNPSKPMPMTATRSPTCGSARRNPCMAIAPRVAKAADSKSTESGSGISKLRGTTAYSAWTANPPPAQATRCPILKPCMFSPSPRMVPAEE